MNTNNILDLIEKTGVSVSIPKPGENRKKGLVKIMFRGSSYPTFCRAEELEEKLEEINLRQGIRTLCEDINYVGRSIAGYDIKRYKKYLLEAEDLLCDTLEELRNIFSDIENSGKN